MSITDDLLVASRSAPSLSPSLLYGIAANQGGGTDVPTAAGATAGFGSALKLKNSLLAQDDGDQRRMFGALSADDQRMLTAAGYTLPTGGGHRSLWGHITHAVSSDVLAPLGRDVLHPVGAAAGEALHYAGAPLRQLQHAYRAAGLMQEEEGRWNPLPFFTPSDWARTWRASEHGERTFLPTVERDVEDRYGPDTTDLAKRIAGGTKPDDLLRGMDPTQAQALAKRLNDDADLKDAVARLESGKISFGRSIVGDHYLYAHPGAGKVLSGGLDAVGDWFGDPLVIGSKAAKAAEVGRFLVQGPADVDRLVETNASVQRYMAEVADHLSAAKAGDGQALGRLAERHPALMPVIPQLVSEGVTTTDDLHQWFRGEAGLRAMLTGKATGVVDRAAMAMPHLTQTDRAALWAKGALRGAIDFAAEEPHQLAERLSTGGAAAQAAAPTVERLAGPGTAVRRFLTLTPKEHVFDPNADAALTNVQRVASYSLPTRRVRELVGAYANAPTVGAKKQVWFSMLGDMFQAARLDDTPEAADWAGRFLAGADDAVTKRLYSVDGIDRVLVDGRPVSAGLLGSQLNEQWALPSFKDLWTNSKKASFTRAAFGQVNRDFVDRMMSGVWKPLTLLRIGFPVRAGGEELVGGIMREGGGSMLRARAATGAAKGAAAGEADRLLAAHPLARAVAMFTDHLPESVRSAIHTPSDLASEVLADRARRTFRGVEGALSPEQYRQAAREWVDHGPGMDGFADAVSATHSRAAGYLDDDATLTTLIRQDGKMKQVRVANTGNFKDYVPVDDLGLQRWKLRLDEVANNPESRIALAHFDADPEARVRAVADHLQSPEFARSWNASVRSTQDRAGRLVASGEITKRQAAEDWASAIVAHVDSLVAPEGTAIADLPKLLAEGKSPTLGHLNDVPFARRPPKVSAPEVVPVANNWFRTVMDKGFDGMVGPLMNWIAREPLAIHNYAEARQEVEGLRALGAGDDVLRQVAQERAITKTIPFIHDPAVRSQAAVVTRNLMPFWFAQEQFFKRWAATAVINPAAFRQAQLTMMGLRHSGVIHTDDTGQDHFMYPGVGFVQDVLMRASKSLLGVDATIPMPVGFSGQVRFATPGLERLGVPSFGPLVSLPLRAMVRRFPELEPIETPVLGERGAGRSYWEQIVPTTLTRVVHVLADRPDTSAQMASAMMQATQYLEATGHGLKENATPTEREHYNDRLQSWARILLLNRAIFGYSVPAAPEAQLDPRHLNTELRGLMDSLPVEQAFAEFIRRHPDATPYTVFQSTSASGATLPATKSTLAFMDKHGAFLKDYPAAGGWLIPQTSGDESFSPTAYREQLALELRKRKGADQFLTDVKFAQAAGDYFDTRDARDAALAAAGDNSARKSAINQQWAQWSAEYQTAHPVFAEQLQSPAGRIRRAQAIDQLHSAFADPRLPKVAQAQPLKDMLDTYDALQTFLNQNAGLRTAAARKGNAAARTQFTTWATTYIKTHPEIAPAYHRLFAPDVAVA